MNDDILRQASKDLSESQKNLVMELYQVPEDEYESLTEEDWEEIYDLLCDMEVDALFDALSSQKAVDDSEELVFSVIDLLGNAIAEAKGYLNEYDDEADE